MATPRNCSCEEGLIRNADGSITRVTGHDCDYIRARNALIPKASSLATEFVVRQHPDVAVITSHPAWSRKFFSAMNQLAFEAGLISSPPNPS